MKFGVDLLFGTPKSYNEAVFEISFFFANLWLFNAWLKSSCRLLKFGKQADFYLTIVDRTILSLVISLFFTCQLKTTKFSMKLS